MLRIGHVEFTRPPSFRKTYFTQGWSACLFSSFELAHVFPVPLLRRPATHSLLVGPRLRCVAGNTREKPVKLVQGDVKVKIVHRTLNQLNDLVFERRESMMIERGFASIWKCVME